MQSMPLQLADAPASILIAEDSPTQAQRLQYSLEQRGYRVRVACNGRQALAQAAAEPPALIISDVVMPEIDGYELTRRIKASATLHDIPVILVTTMSDPQDVIRGLECGADSFILKPYDEQYLIGRVRYILLNRELRQVNDVGIGVEILFNGQRHYITADRLQILNLLLSTYEAAIQRNEELSESRDALQRTTEEVLAGHRFLDSMLENIPVAIFIVDVDELRYVRLNRAAETLMEHPRDELIGKTAFDILSREEAEAFTKHARRVLALGTVEDIPWTEASTRNQEVRTLRTRLVPVLDAYGDASHLLVMREDITESVKANAVLSELNAELMRKTVELERLRQQAEEASRAKSAFLAAMSHEIRTPMNGVIGMIDVLQQSSLMSHQVEMVDLIRESAFSLLEVIEDILDFSKIEAGKLEIECAPMAVADVVEKACGLLDSLAVKKHVQLRVFVDPAVPNLVLGDALRLRQVLTNLISNAIKFSSGRPQPGQVSVRVTVAARSRRRITLELRVVDNGIGMDEPTKARLFTSFTQADASTTRRFGGTGLGLAISSHLVTLMDGGILVHSTPGTGSTFVVTVPFELPSFTVVPAAEQPLAGLPCLIVGPDEETVHNHAAYLEHAGVTAEHCASLETARTWAQACDPGTVVWLVDIAANTYADALRAASGLADRADIRLVVIDYAGNERRVSYVDDSGQLVVEGHLITYQRLVKAVARVAGRMEHEPEGQRAVSGHTGLSAPSRREALRQRRLVLVAEDNEANQKVITHQLGLLGIAADIVSDGGMALERWRSGEYALVISDLHMPIMDGYQLTTAIRDAERGARRTPIVALSANTIKDEVERCLALGMDDYLSKPVRLNLLRDMIDKWLPAADGKLAVPERSKPVDVEMLKSLVGDDPAVVDGFLRDFGISAQQTAAQIRSFCLAGDAISVATEAHKLKSSARSMGAMVLGELCELMESHGNGGHAQALTELLPTFDVEIRRLDEYLKSLAEYDDAQPGRRS
jgi:PAS domain S-box-containing protein